MLITGFLAPGFHFAHRPVSNVRIMKRVAVLICAGVGVSLFAGCASIPLEAQETSTPPTPTASAALEQEIETKETEAVSDVDPLACFHGTWIADNDFFLERLHEFGDEVNSVDGEVRLTFAPDGTLSTAYQDWTISAAVEGSEVQIFRSGVDTGTYTVTAHAIDLTETVMGSALTLKRGALEMPIEPIPAVYNEASYFCSAEEATIETADGELRLTRQQQ